MMLSQLIGLFIVCLTIETRAEYGFDSASSCGRPEIRRQRARAIVPCDLNRQTWCDHPGAAYPWRAVKRFVKENHGLMRRMYGDERHFSVIQRELENNDLDLDDPPNFRKRRMGRKAALPLNTQRYYFDDVDANLFTSDDDFDPFDPLDSDDRHFNGRYLNTPIHETFNRDSAYGGENILSHGKFGNLDSSDDVLLNTKFQFADTEFRPSDLFKIPKDGQKKEEISVGEKLEGKMDPAVKGFNDDFGVGKISAGFETTKLTVADGFGSSEPLSFSLPLDISETYELKNLQNDGPIERIFEREASTTMNEMKTSTPKNRIFEHSSVTTQITTKSTQRGTTKIVAETTTGRTSDDLTTGTDVTQLINSCDSNNCQNSSSTKESTAQVSTANIDEDKDSEKTKPMTMAVRNTTTALYTTVTPSGTNEKYTTQIDRKSSDVADGANFSYFEGTNVFTINNYTVVVFDDEIKDVASNLSSPSLFLNSTASTTDASQTTTLDTTDYDGIYDIKTEAIESTKLFEAPDMVMDESSKTDLKFPNDKDNENGNPGLFQDIPDQVAEEDDIDEDVMMKGVNACPVKEEVVAPFWANNTRGEILALLNLYPFEQYVHWERCSFEHKQMYCRDGCRCEQQYRLHRLLAYDPNNECRGIFSDWFKFPSCCVCKCYGVPSEFRGTSRSPRRETMSSSTSESRERKERKYDVGSRNGLNRVRSNGKFMDKTTKVGGSMGLGESGQSYESDRSRLNKRRRDSRGRQNYREAKIDPSWYRPSGADDLGLF